MRRTARAAPAGAANVEGAFRKLTPYTITNRGLLRVELAEVPEVGYAVERQEYQLGIGCVAAPFFDRTGRVARSLTVSMPAAAFNADESGIARTVIACANAAGYPREDEEVTAA